MVLILLYNGYESESKLRKYNECARKTGEWMLAVGAHTVTCVSLSHHSLSPDVQVAYIDVALNSQQTHLPPASNKENFVEDDGIGGY